MLVNNSIQQAGFAEFQEKVQQYPPVHIFAGTSNPTPKDKKSEIRCIQVSEAIYRIGNPMLQEFRNAWQQVDGMYLFAKNIKTTYCIQAVAKFDAHLRVLDKEFEIAFKQEPMLRAYFEHFRLHKDIRSGLLKMLALDLNEPIGSISEEYKKVLQEELDKIAVLQKTTKG